MRRRKAEHNSWPTVHQGTEHLLRFLGVDTTIPHHGHTTSLRSKVDSGRAVGHQTRQCHVTGVSRTLHVEIYDQGGPGRSTERQRRNDAEHLVLRRPDGERRHFQLHV